MDKIKASEFLNSFTGNLQKAYIEEENRFYNHLEKTTPEISTSPYITFKRFLEIIRIKDDFYRMSFTYAMLNTLIELGVVESDLDLSDDKMIDELIIQKITETCDTYNK